MEIVCDRGIQEKPENFQIREEEDEVEELKR